MAVLLDVGGVALAIGLALVGFAVVVLVSVLVLRLLGVVLGEGRDPASPAPDEDAGQPDDRAADADLPG